MKKICMLILGLLLFAGVQTGMASAPEHLEGLWQAENYNVSIQIEETRDGIRVRRTDQNDWFYYQYNGRGEYLNRNGNTYELVNNNKMVFNNARRNNTISFYRTNRNDDFGNNRRNDNRDDNFGNNRRGDYRNDDFRNNRRGNIPNNDNRWNDYGYDDPYYDGYRNNRRGRIDYLTAAKLLDGRWINNRIGTRMAIARRGPNLVVFFNGRDRLYQPTNNGFFVDSRGNSIKLVGNGKLVLRHRRFARPVVFLQSERIVNRRGIGYGPVYGKGYGFDW